MAVTQGIFGINVAVCLGMTLAVGFTLLGSQEWLLLGVRLGANYGPYTVGGQWWRLIAYQFIHGGLLHIAFNMWCLWNLGQLAESVYGSWTFGAVYLICGMGAGINSLLWHFNGPSVGASGAIFGVAGALIASFYLGEFSLPRSATSGLLRSVLTFVGYNLFFGAAIAVTDNAAHIGGLITGLILGALIAKAAPQQDDIPRRIAVLLVGILVVGGGVLWLQHAHPAYLLRGQLGVSLLREGKTDEAIADLQRSIKQRPDFAATHSALARAYLQKHDLANATAEMNRVIALDPRNEDAHYRLGLIYLEQKLPSKAQEVFAQLLKVNPRSAYGHAGMAAVLSDERRYPEALEEYKQVAAIDPDYEGLYYNMGAMQANLGQYDDAIASLLKQQENADDSDNENLLAKIYEEKGMMKEATAAKEKAAQLQGPNK
jgi:rhomboid protease GluP